MYPSKRARPCLPLSTRLPRLTRAPAQLLRRAASSQDKGDDPLKPDGDARLDRLWPGRAVTEAEEILASASLPHGFEAAAPSKKARVFALSLRQRQAAQSANRAFLPLKMSAIIDLFDDYAGPARQLDRDGLRALLASVGERPDDATLEELFHQVATSTDSTAGIPALARSNHPRAAGGRRQQRRHRPGRVSARLGRAARLEPGAAACFVGLSAHSAA